VRRVSLFVAVVALFASGLVPTIASATDPLTVGSSEGRVDSCRLDYDDASQPNGVGTLDAQCEPNWKIDLPNDPTGSVSEKRLLEGATPTGIPYRMEVRQTAGFELTSDGMPA